MTQQQQPMARDERARMERTREERTRQENVSSRRGESSRSGRPSTSSRRENGLMSDSDARAYDSSDSARRRQMAAAVTAAVSSGAVSSSMSHRTRDRSDDIAGLGSGHVRISILISMVVATAKSIHHFFHAIYQCNHFVVHSPSTVACFYFFFLALHNAKTSIVFQFFETLHLFFFLLFSSFRHGILRCCPQRRLPRLRRAPNSRRLAIIKRAIYRLMVYTRIVAVVASVVRDEMQQHQWYQHQ